MNHEHDLSPRDAIARVQHLSRRAQRRANWPGWMFLTLAVVNTALFVAIGSGNQHVRNALSAVPALLVGVILLFATRQPVIGRDSRRVNLPILIAAIPTNVAGLVVYQTVMPQHFTGWLLALAVAMSSPLLVGAWLWLRR
jgi:undecaprenyl pyrophosphate phosphatase UppP